MHELIVEIPGILQEEGKKLQKEVGELIAFEEKRKLLSVFIDEVMKGAKQLSKEELIKEGREIKKQRFRKLKQKGLLE